MPELINVTTLVNLTSGSCDIHYSYTSILGERLIGAAFGMLVILIALTIYSKWKIQKSLNAGSHIN